MGCGFQEWGCQKREDRPVPEEKSEQYRIRYPRCLRRLREVHR